MSKNFDSPGFRVTVPVSSVVAPNSPPKSGDPCVAGRLVGVAEFDGVTGDNIVLAVDAVYKVSVASLHETGIHVGETVYIDPTTAVVSDDYTDVPFGIALDPVTLAATTLIRVRLFGGTPGVIGFGS
jgi:predicted RecA/RadA family phage recombinase